MEGRTKDRNVKGRDCVTATQKATGCKKSRCKSRLDLILVERVSMIGSTQGLPSAPQVAVEKLVKWWTVQG